MIRECKKCHTAYSADRSTAELRLTYCGQLCQLADIGVSIRQLLEAGPRGLRVVRREDGKVLAEVGPGYRIATGA